MLLTPFRPTPDLNALLAALDAGDVSALLPLADAWEEIGQQNFAGYLRALAADARPEAVAWRALVAVGKAAGIDGNVRLAFVPNSVVGMARAEASFFDCGDGNGVRARLKVKTTDRMSVWLDGWGWDDHLSVAEARQQLEVLAAIRDLAAAR